MNASGVSDRIYNFAKVLVGHFAGGLGHVNVVGSLIFSGMSGSAIADAGGLGVLEIEQMKKHGYPEDFSGALTCASCIIGPLVPPSIPMVIYGVIASTSVGALFVAGIVPGLLTAIALMIYVHFWAIRNGFPRKPRASAREMAVAFRESILPLLAPVIIMGGIFGGIFTPTEAAAVTAAYSLLLGMAIYRTIGFRDLPKIFRDAVNISAVVGFIVACASLFGWVLAREQVPQQLAHGSWFLARAVGPAHDHQHPVARARLLHGRHGNHDSDGAGAAAGHERGRHRPRALRRGRRHEPHDRHSYASVRRRACSPWPRSRTSRSRCSRARSCRSSRR